MTVIYTHEVATGSKGFGNFVKLLLRWRGSIYKLVLADLAVYLVLFYSVNFVYRFWLQDLPDEDNRKRQFINLVNYCEEISAIIPLQFVLGFYVSQIVTRWWSQFMGIPWPDTVSIVAATCIHGHDDRGRMMRRTVVRYVNLCLILTFTMISTQARARFPTLEHLVEAGILLPHEKLIIEHLNEKLEGPKYYVPIVWAGAICTKARKEGRIRDDVHLYHLIKELCRFRQMCADLLSFDWVCVPLVYTQVVTLATYVYFFACLLGKQTFTSSDKVDIFVPIFHFLEFFFLMGWLKVAETMVNPFGEDDDDFEVNWLIDRDFTVGYMIVDEMNTEFPEMVKDQYWDDVVPEELYYTENALKYKTTGYTGSAEVALSTGPDNVSKKEGSIIESGIMGNSKTGSGNFGSSIGPAAHRNTLNFPNDETVLANLYDHTYEPKKSASITDGNNFIFKLVNRLGCGLGHWIDIYLKTRQL